MYRPPVRLYLNVFITSTNDVSEIYSIFRQIRLQFEFKLTSACINVQAGYSLISSLYVCMAIKHIIVLFVETPR
jgi:hypothetical protein